MKKEVKVLGVLLLLLAPFAGIAQERTIDLDSAVAIAVRNNSRLKVYENNALYSEQMIGSAINIDKPEVYYHYDENNIAENGEPINVFGISQSLRFPTVYGAQRRVKKQEAVLTGLQYDLGKRELIKSVTLAYYNVIYRKNVLEQYRYLDSLYSEFSKGAKRRFELGESNLLEKLTAQTKQQEISVFLEQSQKEMEKAYTFFEQQLQSDTIYKIRETEMPRLEIQPMELDQHPMIQYYEQGKKLSEINLSLERQQLLPDLNFSLFQGTNNAPDSKIYSGFQVGVAIPLWFYSNTSKINAAKTRMLIADNQSRDYRIQLESVYRELVSDLEKYRLALSSYDVSGKELSNQLTHNATIAYKSGEIDFFQYVQLLESSRDLQITYLENLFNYNKTVIELNYLTY